MPLIPLRSLFILLVCLLFSPYINAKLSGDLPFPDKTQRKQIANKLLLNMETIDAISIELRNTTRKVNWQQFKDITRDKIIESENWQQLYRALDNIHYGILNRHSFLLVADTIKAKVNRFPSWPSFEIGYTWPDTRFFAIANAKTITSINDQDIEQLFSTFFNLYCNQVHHSGCLRLFSKYMGYGYWFVDNSNELSIKYQDGSKQIVERSQKTPSASNTQNTCQTLYPSLALEPIFESAQSCLFRYKQIHILKLKHFGKWGTEHSDIYCRNKTNEGMCFDIKQIRQLINQHPNYELVIDLQNNPGGSENTPWVAALTQDFFYDNLVAYKNIDALANTSIREYAFYFSERAENWYQQIAYAPSKNNEYLPARADFCRGSKTCAVKPIPSSQQAIKYKKLKLVLNENCVSSCDDLVWRLQAYANAKTYGQLPATDGTYARLHGYLSLDNNGRVVNQLTGEGQEPNLEEHFLLVRYQLPISKTMNMSGIELEGNSDVLDYPFDITVDNFTSLTEHNLKRTLAHK